MNITLTHPVHGAKIATMDLEAEMDEKNGWTRYNPDTPSEPEEAAPVNALGTKRKNRKVEVSTELVSEGV